jgi:hypothetical protein
VIYAARGVPQTLYSTWSQDRLFFVPLVIVMWCLIQLLDTKGWIRYASGGAASADGRPYRGAAEPSDLPDEEPAMGGAEPVHRRPPPLHDPDHPEGWTMRYEPRRR